MVEPRYPSLIVSLDEDGLGGDNIYVIASRVMHGLKALDRDRGEIMTFQNAIRDAPSYSAALDVVRAWVRVENASIGESDG